MGDLGHRQDAHNLGSIAVSSDGTLHIVGCGHENTTRSTKVTTYDPCHYWRSTNPEDTSSWELVQTMFEDNSFTYPVLEIDSRDNLHLIMRNKKKTPKTHMRLEYRGALRSGDDWQSFIPTKVLARGGYSYGEFYNRFALDNNDNLYVYLHFLNMWVTPYYYPQGGGGVVITSNTQGNHWNFADFTYDSSRD